MQFYVEANLLFFQNGKKQLVTMFKEKMGLGVIEYFRILESNRNQIHHLQNTKNYITHKIQIPFKYDFNLYTNGI